MLIGSAVFPIAFCMMWSKCNKYGAIAGAFIGQWTGITVWLCYAKIGYKTINLTTTGYNYPMLAGELPKRPLLACAASSAQQNH